MLVVSWATTILAQLAVLALCLLQDVLPLLALHLVALLVHKQHSIGHMTRASVRRGDAHTIQNTTAGAAHTH